MWPQVEMKGNVKVKNKKRKVQKRVRKSELTLAVMC